MQDMIKEHNAALAYIIYNVSIFLFGYDPGEHNCLQDIIKENTVALPDIMQSDT